MAAAEPRIENTAVQSLPMAPDKKEGGRQSPDLGRDAVLRPPGTDFVAMQEEHDRANLHALLPGIGDPLQAYWPDAVDGFQPGGIIGDHFQYFGFEVANEFLARASKAAISDWKKWRASKASAVSFLARYRTWSATGISSCGVVVSGADD